MFMKYSKLIITALLAFVLSAAAYAADTTKTVRFAYDLDLEMRFDNREYYKSRFSRSMTVFGARVTPALGIAVGNDPTASHKVMVGADVMKDFGGSHKGILREVTFYYNLDKDFGDTGLSLYAGIFPRRAAAGSYSTAFFSDSLAFYDNNLEGLLVQVRRPKAQFEIACDWMGQYGDNSRERFMIFSSGEGLVAPFLSLGYSAYMYHYANSLQHKGVVDNILLNPYIRFDFGEKVGMQRLSARLGWLQALQHDRDNVGHYVFPGGGEIDFEARHWNVGVSNRLFVGKDMMPYYNSKDNVGDKYGNTLYMGDPFYRLHDDGSTGLGMYDRLEFYYEPKIKGAEEWLTIRIVAMFHFNSQKYCGTQQVVMIRFNLP